MLKAGSTVVFDVQGSTGGALPVDDTDLRNAVINNLAAYFEVLNVSITKGSMLTNILDFEWLHWNYAATVTIQTRMDYGDVEDLRGVIATAFYNGGGAVPVVTIRGYDTVQGPAIENQGPSLLAALTGGGVLLALAAVAAIVILVKLK